MNKWKLQNYKGQNNNMWWKHVKVGQYVQSLFFRTKVAIK